jgi:hypothetical protein
MHVADALTEEDILGIRRKLIVLGSRSSSQVPRINRTLYLPLLTEDHPMAKMYME